MALIYGGFRKFMVNTNYKPLKLFLLNEASGGVLTRPNLLNGLKPGSNII